MNNNGFADLGNTIGGAMRNMSKANNTISCELGVINADMSLTPDNFPCPIPKGSYMVDVRLTSNPGISLTGEGTHSGHEYGTGAHSHEVKTTKLKAGDRVLICKVGNERIVTCVITSSENL